MTIELDKTQIKSLTHALHAAMKKTPQMKLSEFREVFSKEVKFNDWNTLLGMTNATQNDKLTSAYEDGYSDYDFDGISKLGFGELANESTKSIIEAVYKSEFFSS